MKIPEDLIGSVIRAKTGTHVPEDRPDTRAPGAQSGAKPATNVRADAPAAPSPDFKAEISGRTLKIRSAERQAYSVPPEVAARAAYERGESAKLPPREGARDAVRSASNRANPDTGSRGEQGDSFTARRRESLGVERSVVERKIAELRLRLASESRKKADSVVADFDRKQQVRERKSLEREVAALDRQIAGIEREKMAESKAAAYEVAKANLDAQSSASARAGSVSSAASRINTVV